MANAVVGIVMGSSSDWETMKAAAKTLEEFGVAYEAKAMSEKLIAEQIARANSAIFTTSQNNPECAGMGTTLVVCLFFDNFLTVAHIGDSRLYRLRGDDTMEQVTRDHSLVARLVEAGAITRDEVYTHPDRNKVYRGLGEKGEVKVDWFTLPIQPGDHLVLCSDGLWEMVRDKEIERILKKHAAI